jgi:hypothetical protein
MCASFEYVKTIPHKISKASDFWFDFRKYIMTYHARGRDIVSLLEYEAFRRPEIAEFLDGIASVDDAAIDAFPVPLPWYRKAMKILRDRKNYAKRSIEISENIVAGTVADPSGTAYEYRGPTTFFSIGSNDLQVETNTLVFAPDAGGLWIDQIFSRVADPRLMAQSVVVGSMTLNDYNEAYRDRIRSAHPIVGQTIVADSSQPLSALGVRIMR